MDNKAIREIQQWALFEFVLSIGMIGYGLYWYLRVIVNDSSTEMPLEGYLILVVMLVRTILLFRAGDAVGAGLEAAGVTSEE